MSYRNFFLPSRNSEYMDISFLKILLAREVGIPDGQRLGGQLVTTLVATINIIIFHFFLRCAPFLKEGVLESRNLFGKSSLERQKT